MGMYSLYFCVLSCLGCSYVTVLYDKGRSLERIGDRDFCITFPKGLGYKKREDIFISVRIHLFFRDFCWNMKEKKFDGGHYCRFFFQYMEIVRFWKMFHVFFYDKSLSMILANYKKDQK